MGLRDSLLPNYGDRIEELRRFRDEYNSTISRVQSNDTTPVGIEIDEDLADSDLRGLNKELKSKLEPRDDPDDGHYVAPVENRDEVIQELEGLVEYADDQIKSLKRRKLGWVTTVITLLLLVFVTLFNIPPYY